MSNGRRMHRCSSLQLSNATCVALSVVGYSRRLQIWSLLGNKECKPLCNGESFDWKDCSLKAGNDCLDSDGPSENGGPFCNDRELYEVLYLVVNMCRYGRLPPLEAFVDLLKGCSKFKALSVGRKIHTYLINHGVEANVLLGNLLIGMYIKCESFRDAFRWFDKMFARDVFTWTLVITAYVKNGEYEQALWMFWRMKDEGVRPNNVTCLSIIKACTCLLEVKTVFAYIVEEEFDFSDFVLSNLLDVYAKSGALDDAYCLFQKVKKSGVVPWNAMITGFSQLELHDRSFALFGQMLHEFCKPDEVTYLALLKSCINRVCLKDGQKLHALFLENEMQPNIYVVNTIMDMYAKLATIEDAAYMFNKMSNRDVVSWSVMISAQTQHGYEGKALLLFEEMLLSGIEPNKISYMCVLKACAILRLIRKGQHIHLGIALRQLEHDPFIGSSLVDMYSKCGSIEDAHSVFVSMPKRDTVMWNSLIDGCTELGESEEALNLVWHMICDGFRPDEATFVSCLKACVDLADLEQARRVHSYAVENSVHCESQVGNSLIEMYAKCGCMLEAHHVFYKMLDRPLFAWTTAIAGYIHNDLRMEVLQLSDRMKLEGVVPNDFAISALSKAYESPLSLNEGKQFHAPIIQLKLDSISHVGNSLVDMYTEIGSIACAHQVFYKMPQRDVVAYNTIISTCVQNGLWYEAMNAFHQMLAQNVKADSITYVPMLKACGSLASLELGMHLHTLATEGGHDKEDVLRGILVDMYVKCGCLAHARNLFDRISEQDTMSWTAMLSGCAQHGLAWEAILLLEQTQKQDVGLDEVTFIGALSACSFGGLVDEGLCCFYIMHQNCGMVPSSQHYARVVDLLGRAGRLGDALYFVENIPCHPAVVMWTTLLAACKLHGELEIADLSAEGILGLEPGNVTAPALLSNLKAVCVRYRMPCHSGQFEWVSAGKRHSCPSPAYKKTNMEA